MGAGGFTVVDYWCNSVFFHRQKTENLIFFPHKLFSNSIACRVLKYRCKWRLKNEQFFGNYKPCRNTKPQYC